MTCPTCGAALVNQLPEWLDAISGFTILTLRCLGCGQLRVEREHRPDTAQGSLFGADLPDAEGEKLRSV